MFRRHVRRRWLSEKDKYHRDQALQGWSLIGAIALLLFISLTVSYL